MTKVEVLYEFTAPVDEKDLMALDRAHAVYGIRALRLSPAMDALTVEFDASRLRATDVDRALHSVGLRVKRKDPVPPPPPAAPEPVAS